MIREIGARTTDNGEGGEMKNSEYGEYLLTKEWRKFRELALIKAGNACQVCNSTERLNVHHRTYENFGHERLEDVTVLCERCHKFYHLVLQDQLEQPFYNFGKSSVFLNATLKRDLKSDGDLFDIGKKCNAFMDLLIDDYPNEKHHTHEVNINFCIQDKKL